MEEKRCKILDLLRTNKLVLAGDNFCKVLTVSTAEDFTTLISNQEEADIKVIECCWGHLWEIQIF